jgi:hypothetical protein
MQLDIGTTTPVAMSPLGCGKDCFVAFGEHYSEFLVFVALYFVSSIRSSFRKAHGEIVWPQ